MDRKSKIALHVEDIVSATGCEIYLPVPEIGTDGTYQTKQSGTEMLAYHGSCDLYLLRYRRSEVRKSVLVDITDETHSILVDITLNKLVERKLRYFKKSDTWYEFWIHFADKNYNTCVKLDKEDEGFSHFSDNLQRILKNLAKCRNTKTISEYMYKMVGIQSSIEDKTTTKEMQKTRFDLNPVVEEEEETKGGKRKHEGNGDKELANDKNEFADDEDSDGQSETESSSGSSTSAEDDAVEVKEKRTHPMPPPFVLHKFHTLQSTLHKPKNTSDNQFGKSLYVKSTSDMPTKKDLFVERIPSAKSVIQQIRVEGDNDEENENDEENNKITSYAQNENVSSGDGTPVSENKSPRGQECNWRLPVKDFMFDHVSLAKHCLQNQYPGDSNESDTEYLEMAEKKDDRKRQSSDPRFENRNICDKFSNELFSSIENNNDSNTSKVGDFMFDHIPSAHTVVSFKRAIADDKSHEEESTTDTKNSALISATADTTGQAIYLNKYDKMSAVVNNTKGDKGTVGKNGTTTDAMGQKNYKEIKDKNNSDGATNNTTTGAMDQTIFLEMKGRNTSDYVSNMALATVYEPMTNKHNSVSPMASPQQMLAELLQEAINSQDQGKAAEYAQSLAATGTRVKILLDAG